MTRAAALATGLALLATAALAAPARRPVARPALPDSDVARLPHRDLTAREYVLAWHRVDPRYRPKGTTLADRRAFLDQMLERELVVRAATAEPFTMTELESAQYLAAFDKAVSRALYQRLVLDSLDVLPADLDSARVRLTTSNRGKPPAESAVAMFARSYAEPRRGAIVDSLIKLDLAPAWDDSVAAKLARGYGRLDPRKPDPNRPFSLKLNDRIPALAPADTGLVLARSTAGDLTAAEFTRRFALLNPFDSDFPLSVKAVEERGEQFLGQIWFKREAARRGLEHDPDVVEVARSKRESVALDHFFANHVSAKVDTSDATLKPWFVAHKAQYVIPSHSVVADIVAANRASADSIYKELSAGDSWEAVCNRHVPDGPAKEQCGQPTPLFDDYPDSALVKAVKALKKDEVLEQALSAPAAGQVVVLKKIERVERRERTFDEARTFVVREVTGDQSERLLQAELARLKKKTPVVRNERALARVSLEP